jgi:hypothetical protein
MQAGRPGAWLLLCVSVVKLSRESSQERRRSQQRVASMAESRCVVRARVTWRELALSERRAHFWQSITVSSQTVCRARDQT